MHEYMHLKIGLYLHQLHVFGITVIWYAQDLKTGESK